MKLVRLGEAEAKEVIERLSPHMAKKLKDEKKLQSPLSVPPI